MGVAVCDVSVRPYARPFRRFDARDNAVLRERQPAYCFNGSPRIPADDDHNRQPAEQSRRHPAATIRILLADDHAIVRDSLARLLQMQEGMEVVGRAIDGQEAVDLALELKPDVIVMDVSMPRLNGIQATRRIKAALPHVHVIALSMHRESDMAADMKAAGASHYLAKTSSPNDLIGIIRSCSPGGHP